MDCNNQNARYNKKFARGHLWHQEVQKIRSESATIRRTARKCHNQKNIKKMQQSKALPGSVTLKRECRDHGYWEAVPQKVHLGSARIKSTSRECRNQKYCQGVSQFKYLRKCHHQKYCLGPSQSKVVRDRHRDRHNQK